MSYLVTALRWRPQRFDEVVGQQHITTTLKNAIKSGRIAHAYIFAGPRGVGKTTTARILAKRLNCLNPDEGEPCNQCEMCKTFQSGQTIDMIEIDGASNRRINEIRALRDSVKYAPTTGKYKIYIIDEVHMLTNESFNALLKTLEEPPEHTIFIFATTDIHKVPLTIISRCQRFDFHRISVTNIKKQLAKIAQAETIEIDDEALTIIAKKADGALRDAQSLFDQVYSYSSGKISAEVVRGLLNIIDEDLYFEVSEAILQNNFKAAFELTQKLYDNGWNFIDFVQGLIEHFRNILAFTATGSTSLIEASQVTKARYSTLKGKFSEADLLRIINFLGNLLTDAKNASDQRLLVEIGLSKLIGMEGSATIKELIEALSGKAAKVEESGNSDAEKKNLNRQEGVENRTEAQESVTSAISEKFADFDEIKFEWRNFLKSLENENSRAATGLAGSFPAEMRNRNLVVAVKNIDLNGASPELVKKIIQKKFGQDLRISFKNGIEPNRTEEKKIEFKKPQEEKDPVIKAIIEELGGREV